MQERAHAEPAACLAGWLPWTDRAGRISRLKLLMFVLVCAPCAAMTIEAFQAPNAVAHFLRETGVWSMRLLIATLFVSPLRRITFWTRIIVVRRMLGLASSSYAVAHLLFYMFDRNLHWSVVLREAIEAPYLTLGWIALIGLAALGLTANDASIRRLGSRNWNRLHKLIYLAAAFAIAHFLLEIHVDADEIAMISGLFVLSLLFRLSHRLRIGRGFWTLALLSPACGALTALAETAYFRWWTGVDWRHVMASNLSLADGVRPGWWVAIIGLLVAFLGRAIRAYNRPPEDRRKEFAPSVSAARNSG